MYCSSVSPGPSHLASRAAASSTHPQPIGSIATGPADQTDMTGSIAMPMMFLGQMPMKSHPSTPRQRPPRPMFSDQDYVAALERARSMQPSGHQGQPAWAMSSGNTPVNGNAYQSNDGTDWQRGSNTSVVAPASALPLDPRAYASQQPAASSTARDVAAQVRFETGEYVISGHKPCAPDQVGQDLCLVLPLASNILFAAVFDGHGKQGHKVAHQTRELFRQHANSLALAPPAQLSEAFQQLFRHAQRTFEGSEGANHSGTTVTAAVIDPVAQTVRCAHVGDSKAIVASGTCLEFETEDHDFDQADMQRVASCGGEVREFPAAMKTVRRVYGKGQNYPALALSRSIGDTDAHKWGVLADPAVSDALPFKAGNLLVIASDGVWNVLSKEEVLSVATTGSAEEAAVQVVQQSKEAWPQLGTDYVDDISAVVVKALPVLPMRRPSEGLSSTAPAAPTLPLPTLDLGDPLTPSMRQLGLPTPASSHAFPMPSPAPGSAPSFGPGTLPIATRSPMPGLDTLGQTWQASRTSTFNFPGTPTAVRGGHTPTAAGRGIDPLGNTWRQPPATAFSFPTAPPAVPPTPGGRSPSSGGNLRAQDLLTGLYPVGSVMPGATMPAHHFATGSGTPTLGATPSPGPGRASFGLPMGTGPLPSMGSLPLFN